jgi:hypothetical protein
MVGIEHLAGVYLANPPAAASPVIGIAVLAVLAAAVAYEWWQEKLAHR